MADFASTALNLKNVGILVDGHSEYAKGLADAFQLQFTGTIRRKEYVSGDTDYRATIRYFRRQHVEALYLPGVYTDVALIMKEARKRKFAGVFLGGDGWDSTEFSRTDAAGSYFTNHFAPDDPHSKGLLEQFAKSGDADAIGALFYDAMAVLTDALQRSVTADGLPDRNALQQALITTHDVPVSTGLLSFDAHHNAVRPLVIMEVQPKGFLYRASWRE
jgi:branched-chain amino acid transport system substrate-binding protein